MSTMCIFSNIFHLWKNGTKIEHRNACQLLVNTKMPLMLMGFKFVTLWWGLMFASDKQKEKIDIDYRSRRQIILINCFDCTKNIALKIKIASVINKLNLPECMFNI